MTKDERKFITYLHMARVLICHAPTMGALDELNEITQKISKTLSKNTAIVGRADLILDLNYSNKIQEIKKILEI